MPRGVSHADGVGRQQPRQPAVGRTFRQRAAGTETGRQPDRRGLAPAGRVLQGRGSARSGAVATPPAAETGSHRRRRAGRRAGAARSRPGNRPGIRHRVVRSPVAGSHPGGPMYPPRFAYEAPRSLDQAQTLLAEYGDEAKVLAGGQSLVPLLKLRFAAPAMLVDINNVPDLEYHRTASDGSLRVGALCRHADLERSTLLAQFPVMA